ncbi:S8 family serine peptidase [Actinomadura flavalba]|uniref:RCC1 domain-containing protein n=1 Tax=Actinomadura flavalba TaxID=1120938 RepID=UPI000376CD5E|nr:S8 family serine peptidase [Actinomadura flavalba]
MLKTRHPGGTRRRAAAVTAVVAVASLLCGVTGPAAAAGPAPSEPRPGTGGTIDPARFSTTSFSVKFRADREVRLRGGRLVSRDAATTTALRAIFADPRVRIERLTRRAEKDVADERRRLEAKTGERLPDLNSWFIVTLETGGIGPLLTRLNALPAVETAQAQSLPTAPAEPFQPAQTYRNAPGDPAGGGVNADAIGTLPGGRGAGVTITDLETPPGKDLLRTPNAYGAVAAGDAHTLAVSLTGEVWSWGAGSNGQLGLGTTTGSDRPMRVPGLTDVRAVAAAANHSFALRTNGEVWAWGANNSGQLGNGTTTRSTSPVKITALSGVQSIATGFGHALAVLSDGQVRAWGANASGQLGNGTNTGSTTPVTVAGLPPIRTTPGALAAGNLHSLAVGADGKVRSWGANTSGQLGDGSTTSRNAPVTLTGIDDVTQLAAGSLHSLARRADGSVRSWGANGSGQLGTGDLTTRTSPVPVTLPHPVAGVAAGNFHSVATSAADPSLAWGAGSDGQLGGDGDGSSATTPRQMGPGVYSAAAGGRGHTVLVGQEKLAATGGNGDGQLGLGTTVAKSDKVVPVSAEPTQLNTCHEEFSGRPAPAGPPVVLPGFIGSACYAGTEAQHATQVAGVIGADPGNGVGIAGIAPQARLEVGSATERRLCDTIDRLAPGDVILYEVAIGGYPWEVQKPIRDLTKVATAKGIIVVEAAGNGGRDLDDLTQPSARAIMEGGDSGAIIVGAGEPPSPGGTNCLGSNRPPARSRLALDDFGSTFGSRVNVQAHGHCIVTTGVPTRNGHTPGQTDPNKMYSNSFGGTSGASAIVAGAVVVLQGVAKARGVTLTPAQMRQLLVQTGTPQTGNTAQNIGPQPDLGAAANYLAAGLAAGGSHTLAVKNDGTVRAWGLNGSGQLGNGTTTNSTTPVTVTGLTGVSRAHGSVAGGDWHSLAVTGGTVRAWGAGANGRLGNGGTADSTAPVTVSGLDDVSSVAAGGGFSLALKKDGTVWSWGAGTNGQLGDGGATDRTTPVQVTGLTGIRAIAAGATHALAVRADGTVWAWGNNNAGKLGDGTSTNRTTPVQVSGLTGVSTLPGSVAAGFGHSLAVRTDGTVRAWGLNSAGQLGDGTTTNRTTPVTVTGLTSVLTISAGNWHNVATRWTGTGSAWGLNTSGQLGDGTTTNRSTPVAIGGLATPSGLLAGGQHTAGVRTTGHLFTWGANTNGQLGNGNTTNRSTPGQLTGFP